MNPADRNDDSRPPITRREFGRAAAMIAALLSAGQTVRAQQIVAPSDAARPPTASDPAPLATDDIKAAERLLGLTLTSEERARMLGLLQTNLRAYAELRAAPPAESLPPAFTFRVLEGEEERAGSVRSAPAPTDSSVRARDDDRPRPTDPTDLSFLPAWRLASLIRRGLLSPVELTELYLDRLRRIGPDLHCTVSLLEESSTAEARIAEKEIREGRYRGPLHGLPWGAKDLFSAKGTLTTWGAEPFRERRIEEDAAVVARLRDAGAILVAKLSLGELAMGDLWFGGRTRNPWNRERGSSGSSAGPASAVAAGLVAFAIGTETLGSIVSPSATCGVTGLRPTFGRVSRRGAMALSWTMDKIGPICRCAEDCALVLDAIHGRDPRDPDSVTRPFTWNQESASRRLRIAYDRSALEGESGREAPELLKRAIGELKRTGHDPFPVSLPEFPESAMRLILNAEAAAAFDGLTRDGRDDQLRGQTSFSWPNIFRASRFIPAVEYIQAQRLRRKLMEEMNALFAEADVLITPPFAGRSLLATNLTGHPCLTIPAGFEQGMPRALAVMSGLFDEEAALAFGTMWQDRTDWHLRLPPE